MGHDWVFDVLKDLKSYAEANGFAGLAAKADETLQVARSEIGGQAVPSAAPKAPEPD